MTAEILAIGTELLLGDIVNTNAQYLSRELASLGIIVHHHCVVGDNPTRLLTALDTAFKRSDLVITTGGLGPTDDDITREVVSKYLELDLIHDEKTLANIINFFKNIEREYSDTNAKQAFMPKDSLVFDNDYGTAPGYSCEKGNKAIIMLPGPPREMIPMFEKKVKPYLMTFSDSVIVSINLRVFGVSESIIQDILSELMKGENPTISPYAKDGEVTLRITAKAETKEEAYNMCLPVEKKVRAILGNSIYTNKYENLQELVIHKLIESKMTIATAESCTGGLLSKRLTEVSGSSKAFECGIVSYSNRIKSSFLGIDARTLEDYGAVSSQVAIEMAEGVRKLAQSSIGIGITGIAGPDGGTPYKPVGLVYVALSDGKKVYCRELKCGGHGGNEREYIRFLATSNALDMIRLYLLDQFKEIGKTTQAGDINVIPYKINNNQMSVNPPPLVKGKSNITAPSKNNILFRFKNRVQSIWHNIIKSFKKFPTDPPSEKIRKSIFLLSFVVLIFSLSWLSATYIDSLIQKARIDNIIAANNQFSKLPIQDQQSYADKVHLPHGYQLKFAKLYGINKDVVGEVNIPNSYINFMPITQTKDNSYYLKHAFDKSTSNIGNPFADFRNHIKPDISAFDDNTIIYGHNMRIQDIMFNNLTKYNDLSFYQKSPVIDFNTVYGDYKWKVFAVYITNTVPAQGEVFDYLVTNFNSADTFNRYIYNIKIRSIINTSVDIMPSDKILTLSTCSYEMTDLRFVVQARLVRVGESTAVGTAVYNPKPLRFAGWYKKFGGTMPVYPPYSSNSASGTDSSFNPLIMNNMSITCKPNTSVSFDVDYFNLSGNVTAFTLSTTNPPKNGKATISKQTVTYTPKKNYTGADTIQINATDSKGNKATAIISINVNLVPIDVRSETITCKNGDSITHQLVISNNAGGKLKFSIINTNLIKGTVTISDKGVLKYTAKSGFNGTETINISITDDKENSATANISVNVLPPNSSSSNSTASTSSTASNSSSASSSSASSSSSEESSSQASSTDSSTASSDSSSTSSDTTSSDTSTSVSST